MISRRPYFLRAMYEWIVDSGHTPHIVIDAHAPGVEAPEGYATDGKLVVNVSPNATQDLNLGNDYITFRARFSGTPFQVMAPAAAVLAIYARETGQGIVFSAEDEADTPPPETPPEAEPREADKPASGGRPHLKVIK
ncbi:MAG TPA: ClpXP protease specificity-enhancing factor [Gammaproteobacteria bacterium]|nr:ClpXP protease specificity-enhancing factor [Gammaproteobacteria bacterium]